MPEARRPDFSGWVTRNDLLCSDGRIIRADAFAHQDGLVVPGCWNHQHNSSESVWGHVILHSVDGGVRGDAYVNDTPAGKQAKALVYNGDITNFSIFANRVKQVGKDVVHGTITEVSLVFAGANPGAKIDEVLAHDDNDGMSVVFFGEDDDTLFFHADQYDKYVNGDQVPQPQTQTQQQNTYPGLTMTPMAKEDVTEADLAGKTDIGAIIRSMNEDQKLACLVLIGMALENAKANPEDQIKPGDIAPENMLNLSNEYMNGKQQTEQDRKVEPVEHGCCKKKKKVCHVCGAPQDDDDDEEDDQPDTPKELPAEDRRAVMASKNNFSAAEERIKKTMANRMPVERDEPQYMEPAPGAGDEYPMAALETIPADKEYLVDLFVGYALSDDANKNPKAFEDPKVVADVQSLTPEQKEAIVILLGYMKLKRDEEMPATNGGN